jgi:hypothetical protein
MSIVTSRSGTPAARLVAGRHPKCPLPVGQTADHRVAMASAMSRHAPGSIRLSHYSLDILY